MLSPLDLRKHFSISKSFSHQTPIVFCERDIPAESQSWPPQVFSQFPFLMIPGLFHVPGVSTETTKTLKNSGKSRLTKLWSVEEQREEIRDGMKFLCGSSSPASSVTFKPFKRRLVRNRFFLILSLFWCLFFPVFNDQKHVCYKG